LLGDIDIDSADAIKERLSRQKDKIITGELAPSVDSVKSSMIDISARLSGSKSLVEDAGDDEDDLSVAFDDYISNYKDMVDLLEYSSKLPMKAEDRDNMRKAISNAEVEISTYLNNTEESYFLKSNIDPGDSDRIGVQAENFYKQMEYGAYAGLPPVQKAQLRKHVINGVIAEQSNRNARREQGEKVPPLDVMGNTEEAQAFVSNLIQGGLRDIMGEEAYDNQKKAQDDAISFISNAQSEYDRDDTAGKDLFRASALAHGISPDGVDAMISDIQDKESKEQALSPTEITIDLSKENPFEKARELEDMNTPESLALAKKIRDEVGSSQIEQLKKIDQEAYRQLYDFVTLYGYGSKIESAIADKVKGIYRVLTEGAGEEFEVDPTGGAEEVFTQKEGVLNLRVDDADIDNSMNEPLNSGVIVKDGMSAGGISVKDPDLKSSASLIQREEGENKVSGRHVSYKDDSFEEGVVSGGRGHRLTEAEKKKYPVGTPIPDNVVDEWFREDVKKARRASVRAISGFNELPSPVKDAITSLAFQVGEGKAGGKKGLKGFSKTIKILEERPFTKDSAIRASEEILDSRWAKEQTPKRAKRASEMIRNSI
jgi:GH24 family phage-related lysozyme (muramidase)